jgi:hypothetical protein
MESGITQFHCGAKVGICIGVLVIVHLKIVEDFSWYFIGACCFVYLDVLEQLSYAFFGYV